jgi:hypothetical protein
MRSRVHIVRSALVGVIAVAAVACSAGDDVADPTAETFQTVPATEPLFTPSSDEDGTVDATDTAEPSDTADPSDTPDPSDTSDGSTPSADTEPVPLPPTVPDTGVPGIDSTDIFCRSWSEFAGSFQALAGTWALGDPTGAARSEVAASGVILGAATALDEHLPADLESERASVVALVEPLSRRADEARAELVAAGIAEEALDALGEAWLVALIDAGVDDPAIAVVVPSDVDGAAFETASAAFGAAKPPLTEDPSLITDVQTPLTDQYLIANCPDQGTLGGNDNIGG